MEHAACLVFSVGSTCSNAAMLISLGGGAGDSPSASNSAGSLHCLVSEMASGIQVQKTKPQQGALFDVEGPGANRPSWSRSWVGGPSWE